MRSLKALKLSEIASPWHGLALWCAHESVSSPFQLNRMYPGTVGWSDWVVAVLGGVVWIFILIHSMRVRAKAAT
jgi:hypothetical protein